MANEFDEGLDEWETDAMRMLADLAIAGEIPESVKMMNEAAKQHILKYGFPEPIIARAILRERSNENPAR